MRGSTVRFSRAPPVRQSSQLSTKPLDAAGTRRLNQYGAASGGINTSSGRKTVGLAVKTSTFSFGGNDELNGQDFTEKNWKQINQMKKSRLKQTEKRINRARMVKQSERTAKPQYYMGAKSGRSLTSASEYSGKENDDQLPAFQRRRTTPVKRRTVRSSDKSRVPIAERSRVKKNPNRFTSNTNSISNRVEMGSGPSESIPSPLREKHDAATAALVKYEKTLARVDKQVAEYFHEEADEKKPGYETTEALEKHRRNLERAHGMQRTPGMAPLPKEKGKSLKQRDPYLALLLGRLEGELDTVETPGMQPLDDNTPVTTYEAVSSQRNMKKSSSKPRVSLVERQSKGPKQAPKPQPPAGDIIKDRKREEARKRVESNCIRLSRALKSNVVEIQLCIWDWQKTRDRKFKSKEVRKQKRLGLRKDLSRRLSNHRRACVNLIEAVKEWQKMNKTKQAFMFQGEDVYRLIMRMPVLPAAEKHEERTLLHEFSLSLLSSDEEVISWLGFRPGNVAHRSNGFIDTNPFLLPPFDLKRLSVLTGNREDSLIAQMEEEENEGEDSDDEQYPYACAEDMPLCCFICNVGTRTDTGICANCGHKGTSDWQERDAKAREARYEEELMFFEEDKIEKKAMKKKRTEQAKKNKVMYDSQIGDEILLKFNEFNHLLMNYDFQAQEEVHEILPEEVAPEEEQEGEADENSDADESKPTEYDAHDNSYESKYDEQPEEEEDPDADMKKILQEMRDTGDDSSVQAPEELWEQKSQVLDDVQNVPAAFEEKTEGIVDQEAVWEEKSQVGDLPSPVEVVGETREAPMEIGDDNSSETEAVVPFEAVESNEEAKENEERAENEEAAENDEASVVNEQVREDRPKSAVESPKSQLSPASSRASRSAPASPHSASGEFPDHYDDNEMLKNSVQFVPEEMGAGDEETTADSQVDARGDVDVENKVGMEQKIERPLSREEMRAARLAAMEKRMASMGSKLENEEEQQDE
eukprot:g1957.t1